MSFGFIMFILLMFVFVLICLILLQAKTNETNEWVANTNIEKEKELYEIRRRVAILEKSQENEAAKEFFKGICPYTDKPCKDWNCTECEVEKAEREYTESEVTENDTL